jgi:lipopolysaccharide export system protein LptA
MRALRLFVVAVLGPVFAGWTVVVASAQTLDLGGGGGGPLEIFADNGIEWQQDGAVFLAEGNARAVRGDVTVRADVLRAYYRDKQGGGSDIWRLDAEGGVVISSPTEKAYGELATYDVDNSVLVLSGGNPTRLVTPDDTITARGQLEYWQAKRMAVARGGADAVRADKRLKADVLVAYFREDKGESDTLERVEAFDNVRIDTASETVTSQRGAYNVESGIATLTGSVKIIRGDNILDGCRAVVNLNTGISRLFGCEGETGGRVRGLITPGAK